MGGAAVPIKSFNLRVDGRRAAMLSIGARLAILAPLVPVSGRDEPVAVVSPEITELDVPAEEAVPDDKELVEGLRW